MSIISHPLQGAFVADRAIQDNVLIVNEIFQSFRAIKGKEGWMAIKLDMEKAYDRVDWEYLWEILKKSSFCDKFVGWIKECVEKVTFSMLVNNGPTEVFTPKRGLRQWDPLCPFIFILRRNLSEKTVAGGKLCKQGYWLPNLEVG